MKTKCGRCGGDGYDPDQPPPLYPDWGPRVCEACLGNGEVDPDEEDDDE